MADLLEAILAAIARFIAEALLQGVLELVFLGIVRALHETARAILPVVSFGRVQAESIGQQPGSKLFSIYRQNGAIVLGVGHAFLIGLICWIMIGRIIFGLAHSGQVSGAKFNS